MVHGDINMNLARDNDENPCIDPMAIMDYTMGHSTIVGDAASINDASFYVYQDPLMYETTEQTNTMLDNTQLEFRPVANTGKEFVAVARITKGHNSPFVNAVGKAYHYIPDVKHQQFNTTTPLSRKELAEAICDDRAFTVHKTTGTSCAPAGTYLVYRLRLSEPGTRNLRFEAIWDWGDGFIGKASYDFVFLTAHDDCVMKPYTALQKKLLNEIWPEWEKYIDC